MKNTRKYFQHLIVFIVGAILGVVVNFVGAALFNMMCGWLACPSINLTRRNFILLPLLVGLALVINVANYPLGD